MVVLLFGPPGCGKGTQSAFISRRLNIPAISTGDMIRAGLAAGTQNGETRHLVNSGSLVSDDLVNTLVTKRLMAPDCQGGFLLDGYPRTVPQADYLQDLLVERSLPAPVVIHLDVPRRVLLERLTARRHCSQCGRVYNLLHKAPRVDGRCDEDGSPLERRGDDDDQVVAGRLRAYAEMTGPLVEYYAGPKYHLCDGNRGPGEISGEIEELLNRHVLQVRSA